MSNETNRQETSGQLLSSLRLNVQQAASSHPRRSLEEAISEVDREIKVRQRCYDRWIAEGKLTAVDARDRIERLQSALGYLNTQYDVQSVPSTGDKTA